jgi:glycosyltransferase involved in cell wall biosynthesis
VETMSVIVHLANRPDEIRQVLRSIDAAVGFLHGQPAGHGVAVDVVIVDDEPEAIARQALEEYTRGRSDYHVLLDSPGRNRACARNLGASLAAGEVLCFLDGDGVFLENHLYDCLNVLRAHSEVDFVKTQAVLSEPVHPDWVPRIANSLVMNLAVRRRCHERVGGFPDRHLFRRQGERLEHELDIFQSVEDVFYNMKLTAASPGRAIPHATVKYLRRPGNAFDRQYDRFQSEPGHGRNHNDELYELRLKLARALIEHEIATLRGVPSRGAGGHGASHGG